MKLICLLAIFLLYSVCPAGAQTKLPDAKFPAERLVPEHFPAYLGAPFKMIKEGKIGSALLHLEGLKQRLKRLPASEKLYFLEALAYQFSEDHKRALSSFNQALALRGSDSDIYFFRAASHVHLEKADQALNDLHDALWFNRMKLIPVEEFYLQIGIIERSLGNTAKAVEAFNMALAKNPALMPARSELLAINLQSGNRNLAIRSAREALSRSPQDPALKIYLAQALLLEADRILNRDQILEAKKLSAESAASPNLPEAQALMAAMVHIKALLAAGEIDSAEKTLNGLRAKHGEGPEILALDRQLQLEREAKSGS